MPSALTYPGVYIEEIPSGVRTITGVATSIAAIVGRAPRGPIDDPVSITSFAGYERMFGGLSLDAPMSYTVRDFFLNGGAEAVIVRIYNLPEKQGQDPEPASHAVATVGKWKFQAASPGTWGKNLRITIDKNVPAELEATMKPLFNLTVEDKSPGGKTEKFSSLTLRDHPRRVDRILAGESELVRWATDKADVDFGGDVSNIAVPVGGDEASKLEDPKTGSIAAKQKDYDTAVKEEEDLKKEDPPPSQDKLDAAKKKKDDAKTALDVETKKLTAINATVTDSAPLTSVLHYFGAQSEDKQGINALAKTDLFNLLCIPADTRDGNTPEAVYADALAYCVVRRAMLLVDSPKEWNTEAGAQQLISAPAEKLGALNLNGPAARNAAIYFPRVKEADPLRDGQIDLFVPCGIIAGIMARTDVTRGVWKAPAGVDAALNGTQGLAVKLTDLENGKLNPVGINVLRRFPVSGNVVWGARTLRGNDQLGDEYKYVPVRRLALFIEESLFRGTQWVVFEPNDEPLWAMVRLNLGAFMHNLFRQGAFQGKTPNEAYFVKCDRETTNQNDINLGIVNIIVGFAPLKPAEFVVIKIQQIAGKIDA